MNREECRMQVLMAFSPFQDLHFVFGTGRNASLVQREVARREP